MSLIEMDYSNRDLKLTGDLVISIFESSVRHGRVFSVNGVEYELRLGYYKSKNRYRGQTEPLIFLMVFCVPLGTNDFYCFYGISKHIRSSLFFLFKDRDYTKIYNFSSYGAVFDDFSEFILKKCRSVFKSKTTLIEGDLFIRYFSKLNEEVVYA